MKEALKYIMNLHYHKFWYTDYEMLSFLLKDISSLIKDLHVLKKKLLIRPNFQKQTNLSTQW